MFTQFKLLRPGLNAITRRVTFAEQPTWFSLASRIEQLYGIPLQDVGVSYVDSDGDEITLSTHEELQDYYATVLDRHNDAIKFTVKSIRTLRHQNSKSGAQPPSSNNNMYDIIVDEDWQPDIAGIPLFSRYNNPPPPPPKSPSSAFVETVDSSVVADAAPAPEYDSDTGSVPVFVSDNKENVPEGKRPAYQGSDSSDASSVSVIHDDMPDKQPVHVLEFDTEQGYVQDRRFNSHSGSSRPSRPYSPHLRGSRSISRSDSSSRSTSPMIRMVSHSRSRSPRSPPLPAVPLIRITTPPSSKGTPPTNVKNLADPPSPVFESIPIPDPPLPTAGTSSFTPMPSATLPSLGNDVAELLSALTIAFSSHPELSEGLKNIVRNASQGAYWAAERDVMVNDALRAAGFPQDGVAQAAQHAQEEAGRKVSEALNGVFRSLGSIINSTISQGSDRPQSQEDHPTPEMQPMRGRSVSCSRSRSRTPNAYDPVPTRFQSSPPPGDSEKPHIRHGSRSVSRSPSPPTREFVPFRDYSRGFVVPQPRSSSPRLPAVVLPSSPPRLFVPPAVSRSPPSRKPDVVLPRPISPPPREPQPFIVPPPPLSGHYESRRPFYYGHYRPGSFPPPPRPHHRYPHLGPPPPPPGPPPPGPPPRSGSPPMFHRMYPPMWVGPYTHGEHQGIKRSSTLPGRIGGSQSGPDFRGPLPHPPLGTMVASGSARRKAELEEAKQYYKAKKEEWRREKEARRLEKEKRELQRMERMRERERRAPSTRHVVMFDSVEEVPPPIPPHPAGLVNSSPPREALGEDVQKMPTREESRHGIVMERLAGMGFTPKTHSHLEVLVGKHLRQLAGLRDYSQETVIANLLEELFHPQAE